MNEIKAIIFDMDSLMWDTEEIYLAACMQATAEYAVDLPPATKSNTGTGKILPGATKAMDKDQLSHQPSIQWRAKQLYYDMMLKRGTEVPPGLTELLNLLDETLMRRGVVTTTYYELACIKLKCMGLLHRFDKLTCGDQVDYGKPAPDIFLKTAESMHVEPEHCVVLEDTLVGLLAARAAGMMPVLIPNFSTPSEQMKSLAEIVLPSISELYMCFRQVIR